jgi:hypothetical protein
MRYSNGWMSFTDGLDGIARWIIALERGVLDAGARWQNPGSGSTVSGRGSRT